MTPQFHETFWVVAGTAAPIIGLAAIVTAADARDAIAAFRDATERGTSAGREKAGTGLAIATWAYFTSGISVLVQAVVLASALTSLQARSDNGLSASVVAKLLPASMLALIAGALLTARSRRYSRTVAAMSPAPARALHSRRPAPRQLPKWAKRTPLGKGK